MKTRESILWVVLAICVYFLIHTVSNKKQSESSLKSIISEKDKEIVYRRTKDSISISEKDQAILRSIKDVKEYYAKELTALKAQGEYSNKEINSLRSYLKAEFKASTSGVRPTVINNYYDSATKDSIRAQTSTFNDRFFNVKVTMLPGRTIWSPVEYSDTITVAGFQKKKWLLGKERVYVNSFMANKKSTIVGLTNFELKDVRDKRFGIGPAVVYDPFSRSFRIGVGVSYALIKF